MNMLNIFDTNEQIAVNKATANELLKNFTKKDLLKRIMFILAINNDEQVFNLYDGLQIKINGIDESGWEEIKSFLPFKMAYSEDDSAAG